MVAFIICCLSFVRHLSTFSKHFSSETTGSISIIFHMQPSGESEKKVYIFGQGHMTKMAAMPTYSKNLKNLLFSDPLS